MATNNLTVYTTGRFGRIYHYRNCTRLHNRDIYAHTVSDAAKYFAPCVECKPPDPVGNSLAAAAVTTAGTPAGAAVTTAGTPAGA